MSAETERALALAARVHLELRDRRARRLRELRADVAALKIMLRAEEAAHREAVRERDELRRLLGRKGQPTDP